MKPDRRLERLAERIGARSVTVSITFDRSPAQVPYRWEATVTWEHHGEEVVLGGETIGASLDAVLKNVEAEVNGQLLRTRAPGG